MAEVTNVETGEKTVVSEPSPAEQYVHALKREFEGYVVHSGLVGRAREVLAELRRVAAEGEERVRSIASRYVADLEKKLPSAPPAPTK